VRDGQDGLPGRQKAGDLFPGEKTRRPLINKTIVDGLRPYAVGEKLRTLRLKKSMGLVELGQHTGLSPAMLSKLERGKLFPTLPTLLRIAMVFGVGLDFFFADERKRHVVSIVRKQERLKFPESTGSSVISYNFESLDFKASERKLNAFYAEFEPVPPQKVRPHQHPGVELLYMISGKLELSIGSDLHVLDEGDAIYFDSAVRHGYRRVGKNRCSAVIVTV
jgi:transcriptional regulator with XRE-family HTH domain